MQGVTVRLENETDRQAVTNVNICAFEGDAEARVVDTMRQLPAHVAELSLVAEVNGRVVGHVMFTEVVLPGSALRLLALGPMAVLPSQAHRGIGAELVNEAIARARRLGYDAIIEVGQPEFYRHLGFEPASECGLCVDVPAAVEAVTVYRLKRDEINPGRGCMHYPAPLALAYRS